MPFSYDLAVPVGSYYLGAYLDLTNDSPGGPAAGDPSGAAHDETGPTQQVVTANQTTEVAPINLKVQEPGG